MHIALCTGCVSFCIVLEQRHGLCTPMNIIITHWVKNGGSPVLNQVHSLCQQFVDGQGATVGIVCLVSYSIAEHTCTYECATVYQTLQLLNSTACPHQCFSHVHGCMHVVWRCVHGKMHSWNRHATLITCMYIAVL